MLDVTKVEEEFAKAQQELVDSFKERLRQAAEGIISSFYTDLTNYAGTDAHINYHNYLKDHFRESLTKEITSDYGHYSWAHEIRMTLLQKYPEAIRNKIIDDLQSKVKSLEEHIEQLRKRY